METITTEELVLKIENVMDAYGKMTMEQLLEALGSEFNSNMEDDLVITPTPMKDVDLNDQIIKHGTVDALCTFHKDGVLTGMRYWVGMTETSMGSNHLERDARIDDLPRIKDEDQPMHEDYGIC
jgi:hypothetical protein